MAIKDETKMGNRGEILPKQPLLDISGIHPGDRIEIEARDGELIIRKIPSIDEVFDLPAITEMSEPEFHEALKEEKQQQENQSWKSGRD